MIRTDTVSRFAEMVKLITMWYATIGALVKNTVHHAQRTIRHPYSRVSVRLDKRVVPAAGVRVNHWLNTLVPFWNVQPVSDSVGVDLARDGFKVVRADARPVPANVINLLSLWHGAISLFVKPNVTEVPATFPSNSAVTVRSNWSPKFPASCLGLFVIAYSQAVAGVHVQPRETFHVAESRESSNGRYGSAAATAFRAWVGIHGNRSVGVALFVPVDESRVASSDGLQKRVGSIGDGSCLATSATAFSARVRAARVVRVSARRRGPVSAKVSQELSGNLVSTVRKLGARHGLLATAEASTAWIWRRVDGLWLGRAHAGPVVAVHESAHLRADPRLSVLAYQGRQHGSAPTLAKSDFFAHLHQFCPESSRFDRPPGTVGVLMTPVQQVISEDGCGDCLRAAIASVLDLPVDAVPNFIEDKERHPIHEGARAWLAERGKKIVCVRFRDAAAMVGAYGYGVETVVLIGESHSLSANGDRKRHAVVGVVDAHGFRVVHDPDPNGKGLYGGPDQVMWIL